MNREIKYRQPVFNSKGDFLEWHYWGWINKGNFVGPMAVGNGHFTKGEMGQQYIGRKDRSGAEIYEGDIFLKKDKNDNLYYQVVEFKNGAFVVRPNKGILYDHIVTGKIVGNIYENPKLMERG